MRIILVRHGESQGNVNEQAYSACGDPHVPLNDTGWMQAHDAGVFLRDWLNDPARGNRPGRWPHIWSPAPESAASASARWPHIYVSSYLRTRQTLSGILTGMGDDALAGDRIIHEDMRLVEHSFGALAYTGAEKGFLRRAFARALASLSHRVYEHNPVLSYPPFGESPMAVYGRASDFIGSLHRAHDVSGDDDVMAVTHGGMIRMFMMRWFHLPLAAYRDIRTPGNCDIFVIEKADPADRNAVGKAGWIVTRIYDGVARAAVQNDPLSKARLFADADLPPFPGHLKRGPRQG